MNNEIGRRIGAENPKANMKDLAIKTLDEFHNNGLWVAKKQDNGKYKIVQEKLSDDQHKKALDRLEQLDNDGYAPGQKPK
jgi:hypothetical protein